MNHGGPKLFVYGTLRSGGSHEMARLLRANSELIGPAELPQSRLLNVGRYPGVVRANGERTSVKGDLFQLTDPTVLARLDRYEDCDLRAPKASEFIRRQRLVRLHNGRRARAWVYEYNRPTAGLTPIASGVYRPV